MEPALRYEAKSNKAIFKWARAYSTDLQKIAQYNLVVLEDDPSISSHLIKGAPLMKKKLFLKKHPELEGILNKCWLANHRESNEPDELAKWE